MKKQISNFLISILVAVVITAAAGFGLLYNADNVVSDGLYQRGNISDGEIVVIGMDQRAVEEFGPMPWNRSVMADVIMALNSDPDNMPAAIGIDVLYVGNSADPDADDYLVEAASMEGNVLFAAMGTFGTDVVEGADGFYVNNRAVLAWDQPFEGLADNAEIGHINAMPDADSIIRHALLKVDAPDGEVYSFARKLYEMYCDFHGEEPNPLPKTNGDFFYLPYTAGPGNYYDGVSVADIVDGSIDPSEFAGKIVLIGPYTAGMQDEYRTAIDHAEPMYGIEIQANQIDAYRNGFYPQEASNVLQLAILFVVSLALVLFLQNRSVKLSILAWIATAGIWVLACVLCYKAGIILHVLWIPVAATIIFVGSVAVNYIRTAREKRKVTDTFGRYVDPAVMKEVLAQGDTMEALAGKEYDIAVLFVDIRGFTTMSEALQPTEVVAILNKYLTLTTDCVMRNHGTLDKFVGDCTMAFWNAPIPQDDAVYMACRAAMDMVEGSKALGEELQAKFGRTVSFGIGVNWGPAVVGNIGAPKRMDYTAIGDTVNTSARLEANAPGGKILISRAVADILGDRAAYTSLGDTIKLKGKAEGFEILTLDALY